MEICAQIQLRLPRETVWERMIAEIKPEQRRVGAVDYSLVGNKPDGSPDSRARSEITQWNEGFGFSIRVAHDWYLPNVWITSQLENAEQSATQLAISVKLQSPFDLLLRFAYKIFGLRIDDLLVGQFAEIRYQFETGEQVSEANRHNVRRDGIEIVRCRPQNRL